MGFYDEPTIKQPEIVYRGEKIFYKQFRSGYGIEGFEVTIDGKFQKDVIIQQHTNPMNEMLQDKKMVYIPDDSKQITWGCVVEGYDYGKYLVITEPHTNGIYETCKIRKMPDMSQFTFNGNDYNYACIMNNSKLYNDGSYTGESNVFEDDDMRSMVITCDDVTSKFKLFDDIVVNGQEFKIVMIDNLTLKKHDQSFGVLQISLLRTIFGEIKCNDVVIDGCLRFSKMKEKIYNSKARQIYVPHNTVNTGDYIRHKFIRDEKGNIEERVYMVYSEVDMKNEYDTAFCLLCDKKTKLIDENGNIVEYSLYINDNKSMIRESSVGNIEGKDTSSTWGSIRMDKLTMNIGGKITRFLVKHVFDDGTFVYKPYQVVGKDDLSLGGVIILSVKHGQPDEKDDLINGIAYNENYEIEIPPTPPTQFEILGDDEMWMDLDYTYTIDNQTSYDTIWSCNNDKVKFISVDKTNCVIRCDYDSSMNYKNIVLTARINVVDYTKTIKVIGG